jgi:hypothetical protein
MRLYQGAFHCGLPYSCNRMGPSWMCRLNKTLASGAVAGQYTMEKGAGQAWGWWTLFTFGQTWPSWGVSGIKVVHPNCRVFVKSTNVSFNLLVDKGMHSEI